MSHDLRLLGCRPVPMAGYLKAMAVLRLVAEQADPAARGYWHQDVFCLRTELSPDDLVDFFLRAYRPTPIMAPWNGGGGFIRGKNSEPVDWLRNTSGERFRPYRDALRAVDRVLEGAPLTDKPKDEEKVALLARLRAELPDEAVEWLDAVAAITADRLGFAPIYGTGGNDGNFEFTNNFMQRLQELFSPDGAPTEAALGLLRASLFDEPVSGLLNVSIGQFQPGQNGGPNAGPGFEAGRRVNPWDFIFSLEGGILFSAAAARKFGRQHTDFTYPFTVRPAAGGQGAMSVSDEGKKARAEMWLPLWHRPASLAELEQFLQEGRAQVRSRVTSVGWRPAQSGIDFARACAGLGIDRGIDSFQRYAFLERYGRMYYAVPLSRFRVHRRPEADVLDDLDRWLTQVQTLPSMEEPPLSALSALRRVEDAVFQLCQHGGPHRVRELIVAVAQLDRVIAKRPALQKRIPPLELKSPAWIERAWPQEPREQAEFALGLAIGAMQDVGDISHRQYFAPVLTDKRKAWHWASDEEMSSARVRLAFDSPDLVRCLITLAERRLLDEERARRKNDETEDTQQRKQHEGGGPGDAEGSEKRKSKVGFHSQHECFAARLDHLGRFWSGQTRDDRILDYAWAFSAYRGDPPRAFARESAQAARLEAATAWVPYLYALLRVTLTAERNLRDAIQAVSLRRSGQPPAVEDFSLPVPREVLALLAADRPPSAVRARQVLERRLLASGLAPRHRGTETFGLSPRRLLASAVVPISSTSLEILVRRLWPIQDEGVDVTEKTIVFES
ncbi:type I-G CRISPR-associated protein Cas8g1/Csx17 [Alicyclobacillus sendaiensis]|uniref:type I-G CRISPR-associated protein Cas8g1/Csx17 n=1 Tax=Alicyclobacillus sendaiensis TaxID=192387 RepID=UPI0026F430E3|nr:type I-U CRISPR-associated protein Csx17 [Alicyclobacillus sendaiensis]